MNLTDKEKIEIDFWKNSETENPNVYDIRNIVNKAADSGIFLHKLKDYKPIFEKSNKILELGAGQGWASCILKHYFPQKDIVVSDISEFAIQGIHVFEHIFKVSISETVACKSYEIPFEDNTFDLIFCFAAAHHFVKQEETLKELKRVLKQGGTILYLHEPGCRKYIYSLAKKRVNKKRPEVPEDLLLYKELIKKGENLGFTAKAIFSPLLMHRGPIETIYYYFLSKVKFLQDILPCTIDMLFTKK